MNASGMTSGSSTTGGAAADSGQSTSRFERQNIFKGGPRAPSGPGLNPTQTHTFGAGGGSGVAGTGRTTTTLPPPVAQSMQHMKQGGGGAAGSSHRGSKGGRKSRAVQRPEPTLLYMMLMDSRNEPIPKKVDLMIWQSLVGEGKVFTNVRLTTAEDLWNEYIAGTAFAARCQDGRYFLYCYAGTTKLQATAWSSENFPTSADFPVIYRTKFLFLSPDVAEGEYGTVVEVSIPSSFLHIFDHFFLDTSCPISSLCSIACSKGEEEKEQPWR